LEEEDIEIIEEMQKAAMSEEEAFMNKAKKEGLVDEFGNPIREVVQPQPKQTTKVTPKAPVKAE
jgi:hypothetical protein